MGKIKDRRRRRQKEREKRKQRKRENFRWREGKRLLLPKTCVRIKHVIEFRRSQNHGEEWERLRSV